MLQVSRRNVKPTGTLKGEYGVNFDVINTLYVPISQHGYGRMDESFSAPGFCTATLASCLGIVLHCPKTGRTTLSHSPNWLYLQLEFTPIFSYLLQRSYFSRY